MTLRGIKVVEMLGLAPGPFCGMLLGEFGADVVVVQKIQPSSFDVMSNGKKAISVNLKTAEGVAVVRKLCKCSDVVLDTYRPGVMEKLGLGPDILCVDNPRLVYARLTGYGQHGPYAAKAGHDINYVALSGVLSLLARPARPPFPPINILADFGGGGLMCAFGIVAALLERSQSGVGQVIDASMTEGAAYLSSWLFRSQALPMWGGEPGSNILDGGAPFYETYRTKDGKFMSIGALEPQFYTRLLEGLGLSEDQCPQFGNFDETKKIFQDLFLSKTQEEWCEVFKDLDACVTPVLSLEQITQHEQHSARASFCISACGAPVPRPAPRLSRTPAASRALDPSPAHGHHTRLVLGELGYSDAEILRLDQQGHVAVQVKSSL